MATTPTKIHFPTNADSWDPAADMEELARSVRHIVPVANATERNAVADAFGPSLTRPLYVDRADTGMLERNNGSGWEYFMRSHRLTDNSVFSANTFGPRLSATADVITGADGQPQTVILNVRIGGPNGTIPTGGQSTSVGTVHADLTPSQLVPVAVSGGSAAVTGTLANNGNLAVRWSSQFLPNQTVLSFLASYPIR